MAAKRRRGYVPASRRRAAETRRRNIVTREWGGIPDRIAGDEEAIKIWVAMRWYGGNRRYAMASEKQLDLFAHLKVRRKAGRYAQPQREKWLPWYDEVYFYH